MSVVKIIKCSHCGAEFTREYGIGVMGYGTMYCRQCGASRIVDLSGGWEPIAPCACGGIVDEEAMGTCPTCGKLLAKEDEING